MASWIKKEMEFLGVGTGATLDKTVEIFQPLPNALAPINDADSPWSFVSMAVTAVPPDCETASSNIQ